MSVKHSLWRAVAAARKLGPAPAAQGLRVLCYHSIGTILPGDPYGLSVSAEDFRRQMELVASGRFGRPVSLGGAKLDGTPEIAVTFDDGFADTLTAAAPILASLSIPFTVCVTAAYAREGAFPHLALDQLRALARVPGVEIGAHGANHLNMADCDDAALTRELSASRAFLKEALAISPASMTWPHGSASRRTAAAAKAAGFRRAGCSSYGINEPERDPLLLKRTEIVGFDSLADFADKCAGYWDWFALRQGDPAAR